MNQSSGAIDCTEDLRAFGELEREADSQKRGYQFQEFLFRFFVKHGLKPEGSFRKSARGVQHDDLIEFDGQYYLVEEKWTGDPISVRDLAAFSELVSKAIHGTRGLFISVAGFTSEAIKELERGSTLRVVLMDGDDLHAVLEGSVGLNELLTAKVRAAAKTGAALFPASRVASTHLERSGFEAFCVSIGLTEEIGKERSRYWRLRELFVPPTGYSRIRQVLDEEHVVLITGDPHIGKTFTALHLLWDYYAENELRPSWLTGPRVARDLDAGIFDARTLLDKHLLENTVVYLEDPFGMIGAIDSDWFKKDLVEILTQAKARNCRLIITTRQSVLQQSLGSFDEKYVVHLEQRLDLDGAYSDDDRQTIVLNYIELYRPNWASNEVRQWAIKTVAASLECPHNIELFVHGTSHMESFETALRSLGTYRDITRELARWVLSLSPSEQTFLLVAKDFALERDPPLVWAKAIYSALFQTGPSWETVEDSLAGIVVRRPCDPIITEIYEDDYGTDMPPDVREDIKWVPSFSHPVYLEAIHLAADENADLNGRYCDLLRTYAEYQDTILHDRATTEIIRAFALERLFWYGACQRLPFVSIPAKPSLYLTKTYAERDNIPLQVTTFANLVFLIDIAGPKTREILRELWNTTIRGAGARLIEDFSVSPDSLSIETDSDNFYSEITKEQYEAIVAVLELPVDDEGTYDWRRDGHSW